jgi:hypothetical protein
VNVDELYRVGKMLAISGYFDAKGNSDTAIAQICTKILAGREMGYPPFASVQGIHIIQGRPAISANLMASAVKAHPMYDYRVRMMTDKECSIEFFQRNGDKWESLGVSTFNESDARKAGTKNMDKFARNMLFARAMSNGVRWFTPDCFSGNTVYVPEELGATVDGDGNVIDVDYRSVDKVTGEVLGTTTPEATPTGNGNMPPVTVVTAHGDNPFDDDVPEVVRGWATPADAQAWAVEIGASENEHAARNAFKAVVERVASDGKLTRQNMMAVFTVYYHDRMKRAQEKGQAAIADVTLANVPEMAH